MNPLGKSPVPVYLGFSLFFSETLGNSGAQTGRLFTLTSGLAQEAFSYPPGKEDHAKNKHPASFHPTGPKLLHLLGVKVAGKHKGQEEPRYSYDNSQKISLFTWV